METQVEITTPIEVVNIKKEIPSIKSEGEDVDLPISHSVHENKTAGVDVFNIKEEPKAEIDVQDSAEEEASAYYINQNIDVQLRYDTVKIPPKTSKRKESNSPTSSKYTCSECHTTYTKKSGLDLHVQATHLNIKHSCSVCNSEFTRKGSLTKHMRSHEGVRPFQCNICLKWYQTGFLLRRHTLTHSKDKNFECDICHKRFKEKYSMVKHKRTHNGRNSAKCPTCRKEFTEAGLLAKHLRNRTCEKQFVKNFARAVVGAEFVLGEETDDDDDDNDDD